MAKRVFLIVLDSVGIGEMPDSAEYGDEGSNTLAACYRSGQLSVPRMETMGLFNIQGVGCGQPTAHPTAAFGRLAEASKGKDTTIGHWEIAGIISPRPLPTYPEGFPQEILDQLSARTGRKILCNKPYSGTEVLKDYGPEHMRTGDLIVYTSADSVMQIAAHEEVIPVEELYRICGIAREIMQGEHGVGRIIARPFVGEAGAFTRTANRHDFSLTPPGTTMLDLISAAGLASIGVGKIYDIFAGKGITEFVRTKSNRDGMERTIEYADKDFEGLCFVNLVDFDMVYGHRNNVPGYTAALNEFDGQLGDLLEHLREEDLLLITADHGCDPSTPSTDHSREYTPFLAWGQSLRQGVNLGTRKTFSDIAKTILEAFCIDNLLPGSSFFKNIMQ